MVSLALNILLQVTAAAPAAQDYATAYQKTIETGRPLVVLVGAEWCPGCVQMKQASIPAVEKQGGLSKVAFAYVSADDPNGLAQKLMRGGSIPQLIMFHKTAEGWQRQQLTGAQSPSAIQSFLDAATGESVPQVSRVASDTEAN